MHERQLQRVESKRAQSRNVCLLTLSECLHRAARHSAHLYVQKLVFRALDLSLHSLQMHADFLELHLSPVFLSFVRGH
jgi:hypothetical protein